MGMLEWGYSRLDDSLLRCQDHFAANVPSLMTYYLLRLTNPHFPNF